MKTILDVQPAGRSMREGSEKDLGNRSLKPLAIPCPRFIGRQEELLWVQERLEEARRGRGDLVLVAGEAGVGKSRLITEAIVRAQQAEIRVLEGKCSLFEAALPYAPFIEAFRGLLHSYTPSQTAALLGPHASEMMKLLPELAQVIPGLRPSPPLGPAEEKNRLFESLYLVLRQMAVEAPLILALEDIHWADPASLEFMHFLARRLRRDRWLVLATYRPEELGRAEGLTRLRQELVRERLAQEVTIRSLSETETGELLDSVLGTQAHAPESLIAWAFHFGEGNPFFTEEILRAIVEAGDDLRVSLDSASLSAVVIPPTVQETIVARLSHLGIEARGVLGAAAVLGRAFDLGALQEVSGLVGEVFSQAFMSLLSLQVVRADRTPLRYGFRHHLIREVVMQTLAPDMTRSLHRRVGEWLETNGGPTATPQVLAHHFSTAGDREKTVRYALEAASHASSVYAHEEAARYYALALDALPALDSDRRLAVAENLGDAWFFAAFVERAIDAFSTMLTCAETLGRRREMARAHRKLGQAQNERSLGGGLASYEKALVLLAGLGDFLEEEMVHRAIVFAVSSMGQFDRCWAEAEAAIDAGMRAGTPAAVSRAHRHRGGLLRTSGRLAESREFAEKALALARGANDLLAEMDALTYLGHWAVLDGDFTRALEAFEQGHELLRRIGSIPTHLNVVHHLFQLDLLIGRWDDAETLARQFTIQVLGWREHPISAVAASALGTICFHRGRFDEAYPLLLEVLGRTETTFNITVCRNALARMEIRLGNATSAKALLEGTLRMRAPQFREVPMAEAQLLLVEVCLHEGDAAAARLSLEKAVETAQWFRFLSPVVFRVRGMVAAYQADLDGAIAYYQGGLDDPVTAPQLYQEALLRYHLGVCLLRRSRPGDRRAARSHLTDALALLEGLRAEPDAGTVRQALQRIGGRVPSGHVLTEREREVLNLLAEGMSNAAIAARLYISERTVEAHVTHILRKLRFDSRTQAATWAVQRAASPGVPSSKI
ncbi:MAG: ATP-binding protein [bacterium]